jgi:uncharacterized protein YjbI with pentapeptide repeats
MLEKKTPDPDAQSFTAEDVYAEARKICKARNSQGSITSKDLDEAFKILTKKRDSFKRTKLFWKLTGFGEKKLWDVIQILIVPVAIASVGIWFQGFTRQQDKEAVETKTKQETLIKYLDQMSDLLQKGLLKSKHNSEIFIIAQSKTIIALQSLDPDRQSLVSRFVETANLNQLDGGKGLLFKANMHEAKLRKAELKDINLSQATLSFSDLTEANFIGANLNRSFLMKSKLTQSHFYRSKLTGTAFDGSDLRGANFSVANLHGAYFSFANLSGADLSRTDLTNTYFGLANLTNANLRKAYIAAANFEKTNLAKVNFTKAIILRTNLSDTINLEKEQLENNNAPFICKVALPKSISIDANRDCAILPRILLERYPKIYPTLEKAQELIKREEILGEDNTDRTLQEY